MLKTGILNPAINALLSRVRHTNTLVIADRGFPFWREIETIDITLVENIPRVPEVLRAIRANFTAGRAFMAQEFAGANPVATRLEFADVLEGIPTVWEPHVDLKKRVPHAIGLIRTADASPYGNVILESA